MKAQHTPGPWEACRDAVPKGFTQFTIYAEASGARVATAFESEANVSLIAAAPDMLEALEKAFTYMQEEGYNLDGYILKAMSHAINKARVNQ